MPATNDSCALASTSKMLVYCCFNCGHFVLGKKCHVHHVKDCCQFSSPSSHCYNSPWPRTGSNCSHRWVNCGRCMTQQNLAGKYNSFIVKLTPLLTAPLLWTRFLCLLLQKARARKLVILGFGRASPFVELENTILPFLG